LLRSVERSEYTADPWSIRQAAAYHAFDVENGRSLWITVKGNDLLQNTIANDLRNLPVHAGAMGHEVGPAFEASLATHLIYFRWCEQNWRWFIRDIEDRIRNALRVARTLPLDDELTFSSDPRKPEYHVPTSSTGHEPRFGRVSEKKNMFAPITTLPTFRRRTGAGPPRDLEKELFPPPPPPFPPPPPSKSGPDTLVALSMFNYRDLQTLATIARRLEEAASVIQLNVGVLQDACEYYQDAVQSEDIKNPQLRRDMAKAVFAFSRRVKQIVRSLETSHAQLVSLGRRLDGGKQLVSTYPIRHPHSCFKFTLLLNVNLCVSTSNSCSSGVSKSVDSSPTMDTDRPSTWKTSPVGRSGKPCRCTPSPSSPWSSCRPPFYA
jgi:hypothetical protein